ncbi:peptide ABC transporter substrate-binding protein [Staphylococcus gallinarum]|uniref:peptide ABC transporter substrate-binding protein n=3 Tax=Staphylococcus gallinarum TaxID=1293 RepID=UPI000D1E9F37|nr:peptide ABC transporter substrate-binding protein [Staphylococcus gallinarum]MCD8828636.1 peptide ABC transporter substrate-binding protein [Staphylococcus gallinarum]MCD8920741.1 peptide ABC transporter substrate-binding protein [Staphylococcus gallinarum]MDN6413671.1 peptide ABC transporter substrate-binding protein [Staphylococcus gallinarum]MEB6054581.1 peptide ABC transporter substrate-binding protein [Staphylococcus gallinarum]MEB6277366.1 peptide ABC transporter substrate-binding pro
MNFKYFKVIAMLVVASLILSACGNSSGSTYNGDGQVLRKVLPQDMTTFDSAHATDNITFDMYNQVYEGLYTLDGKDQAKPALADGKPKVSNGGKTLEINIRKNAKWSNGDPVTANDFVYAWKRVLNPKTASEYAYIMYDIKNAEDINMGKKKPDTLGVTAINKHKIKIELTKPIPYIKELLAFGTFMPVNPKIVKKYGERYGTTPDKTVFNGPFKVTNWSPEDKIQLVKNNKYWDKKVVKLDKVNFKILKDSQSGASLYDTGSVDDTIITSEQVDKYKDSPALNKRLLAFTYFIKMNEKTVPAFKNQDFRLAVAKAINKKEYVNDVLNNGSTVMDKFTAKDTFLSPNGEDYTKGVHSPLKYNPKEAKKHLDKAKKALGQDKIAFTLNTNETPADKVGAQYLKNQIQTNLPGVTVNIKSMPGKQRISSELSGNYESSLSGWGPDYADPLTFLNIMTTGNSQNNTDWGSKKYDNAIKETNGSLLKQKDKRDQTLKETEEYMLKQAPIAPVFQKGEAHLTNPQVKGVIYHKIGGDTNLKYAYIDKSIDRETGKKKDK